MSSSHCIKIFCFVHFLLNVSKSLRRKVSNIGLSHKTTSDKNFYNADKQIKTLIFFLKYKHVSSNFVIGLSIIGAIKNTPNKTFSDITCIFRETNSERRFPNFFFKKILFVQEEDD